MRLLPCFTVQIPACYVDAAKCFDLYGRSTSGSFDTFSRWNGSRLETEKAGPGDLVEPRVFNPGVLDTPPQLPFLPFLKRLKAARLLGSSSRSLSASLPTSPRPTVFPYREPIHIHLVDAKPNNPPGDTSCPPGHPRKHPPSPIALSRFTPPLMKAIVAPQLFLFIKLALPALGHIGAYGPGMYCKHGADPNIDNQNANDVSQPLFNVTKKVWWMHAENGCDKLPPPAGEFLELPSGGQVTLELATNRAFTTTATQPVRLGVFGNGQDFIFPEHVSAEGCIWEPNLHTKSEAEASGTVLAISYASRITDTSDINLSVISVAYNTPWRRVVDYSIPLLPPCGTEGCICAWGWVPLGCGRPDMYMQPFRCKVVGENAIVTTYKVRPKSAKAPVWCQGDPTKCVKGPKQMIYYNQLEGNNVDLAGTDVDGNPRKPAYDMRYGYANGAQWDVIEESLVPDKLKPLLPGHQ